MPKIPEMTDERRNELARRVVADMEPQDMVDYIIDDLEQLYKNSGESYEVDWERHPPPDAPEKKTYDVRVIRISHRELTFNVKALDPPSARMAALERAFSADYTYGKETYSEYETNGIYAYETDGACNAEI